MKTKITNISDLNKEIVRLSRLKKEQEGYLTDQYILLKNKIETPSRVLGAIANSVPGVGLVKDVFSSVGAAVNDKDKASSGKSDWLTKTLRIGLPFILNRTVLKKSGWLQKSLVLLASEGAAGQINQDRVSSLVSKVSNFIRPKKGRKKHKDVQKFEEEQDTNNFGIPPDSETY